MKKILALFGIFLALCLPSLAVAETLIDQRTNSITSIAPPPYPSSQSNSTFYALDSGTYTLRILFTGFTDAYGSVVSRIFQVDFGTPVTTTLLANIGGAPSGTFSQTYEQAFTVTNAVNRLFLWETYTDVVSGTVQATFQLTKQALPVPGQEAGAGLGALVMAGLAYLAARRRRTIAA